MPSVRRSERFPVLDGWRGISILLVLAAHMLPLGPHGWGLNEASAVSGMAIFYLLSGFLITTTLANHHDVIDFFIKRFFRIIPLALVYLVIVGLLTAQSERYWITHLLFLENYIPTDPLDIHPGAPFTVHFWSLCVELHFYIAIGLWMALTKFRGFWVIPIALVTITIVKACVGDWGTALTHWRVDEILAGGTLALIHLDYLPRGFRTLVQRTPFVLPLAVLLVSGLPWCVQHGFECVRPYMTLLLIGHTVYAEDRPIFAVLKSRSLRYIAQVSYAVYVIHPFTMYGWLGEGSSKIIKYLKRPLCFLLTFALAHLSTFHFENQMIELGRSVIRMRRENRIFAAKQGGNSAHRPRVTCRRTAHDG